MRTKEMEQETPNGRTLCLSAGQVGFFQTEQSTRAQDGERASNFCNLLNCSFASAYIEIHLLHLLYLTSPYLHLAEYTN